MELPREPQVTLWMEGEPKLYCGVAEIVSKEPAFILRMLYLDMRAEAICRDIGSRYHYFCISSELSNQATTFWPYQFYLLSVKVYPEIVTESEAQYMNLCFRVEESSREADLITCEAFQTRDVQQRGCMCNYS